MKKILLIFAHPDDESFSCSGTMVKYKNNNTSIKLITATRGEAGQLGDPPLCLPEELGEERTKELKNAARIIGIKKIFFLGLRDGTLSKFSLKFLSNLIEPILIRENPDIIITFPKTGISGHDDHIVISKAATIAYLKYRRITKKKTKLLYITIPQSIVDKMVKKSQVKNLFRRPFKGTPDKKITTIIKIDDTLEIKIKALMCHKTQRKDWERYIIRTNNEKNSSFEYYQQVYPKEKKQKVIKNELF